MTKPAVEIEGRTLNMSLGEFENRCRAADQKISDCLFDGSRGSLHVLVKEGFLDRDIVFLLEHAVRLCREFEDTLRRVGIARTRRTIYIVNRILTDGESYVVILLRAFHTVEQASEFTVGINAQQAIDAAKLLGLTITHEIKEMEVDGEPDSGS